MDEARLRAWWWHRHGLDGSLRGRSPEKLCDAVLSVLHAGPLDPESIREATGAASRNLGEAGKKKGISTTMPLALGRLQASGDIRRVPVNGRLDQQRRPADEDLRRPAQRPATILGSAASSATIL